MQAAAIIKIWHAHTCSNNFKLTAAGKAAQITQKGGGNMNGRIKEPKAGIIEKERIYGSSIRGMLDNIADAACCLMQDYNFEMKPYLR